MPTVQEIRESRAALVTQMREILDKADAETRPLTAEERATYDRIEADVDSKGEEVETLEGDARRRERSTELAEELKASRGRKVGATTLVPRKTGDGTVPDETVEAAIRRKMSEGCSYREALGFIVEERKAKRSDVVSKYCIHGWNGLNDGERADLQVDNETSGGYMVVPEEFVARLIKFVDDRVYIRQISTVLPLTNADSIGVPTLENDPADADWTSELLIGGTDTTMSVGKRALQPKPLAKLLQVSRTLLRKSVIPAESLVRDRLGYKFAITEEKTFMTGSGAQQPLGVFTASADGIPTTRDVSTANTTTAVTADGLINAKFNQKSQYMASPNLRWVFHRTVVRDIRKLKDGNGQYLWQAGLAGTPDSILEVPYLMSEYAPNTMTTGLYVGIIGDFTWYWIAESLRFELQRLDELYAATNEVGFVGRMELDAAPVLAEAFTRVTLT